MGTNTMTTRHLPSDYAMFTKYLVELSRLMTTDTTLTDLERQMMQREKRRVEATLDLIENKIKHPEPDWGGETGY